MRLLNTATHELREFAAYELPKYAILSHTWQEEEVSFQDVSQPDRDIVLAEKAGYKKIIQCCEQARKDGYNWVWVDTCCIDKTSSVELYGAINSMFRWYKESSVCYAYLADVDPFSPNREANKKSLFRSRWFGRGWTLQELIAPQYVEFYARDWSEIGTKSSLEDWIEEIANIDVLVLRGIPLSLYRVAERMSWAANRDTTREEDAAYCLLGILDINMPLLYGEGYKAFSRLQQEILRQHDDLTLLAWNLSPPDYGEEVAIGTVENGVGVLAPSLIYFFQPTQRIHYYDIKKGTMHSPTQFDWTNLEYKPNLKSTIASGVTYSSGIEASPSSHNTLDFAPTTITNRGLHITLFAKPLLHPNTDPQLLAWISCEFHGHPVCIVLQKSGSAWLRGDYMCIIDNRELSDFRPFQLDLSLSDPHIAFRGKYKDLHPVSLLIVLGSGISDNRDRQASNPLYTGLQHCQVTESIDAELEIANASQFSSGMWLKSSRQLFSYHSGRHVDRPLDLFRVVSKNHDGEASEEVVIVLGQEVPRTGLGRIDVWCGLQTETANSTLVGIKERWYSRTQSTTGRYVWSNRIRHTLKSGNTLTVTVKRRPLEQDNEEGLAYVFVVLAEVSS